MQPYLSISEFLAAFSLFFPHPSSISPPVCHGQDSRNAFPQFILHPTPTQHLYFLPNTLCPATIPRGCYITFYPTTPSAPKVFDCEVLHLEVVLLLNILTILLWPRLFNSLFLHLEVVRSEKGIRVTGETPHMYRVWSPMIGVSR